MKATSIIAAFFALIYVLAPEAKAADSDVIPFEMSKSGHIVVNVRLNDLTTVDAILDTGATFPIIDQASARSVGIALADSPETVSIVGLGEALTFPVVNVDRLALGELSIDNLPAAYNARVSFPASGNVLPAGAIPHRTLDFDFDRSQLRMYDRAPHTLHRFSSTHLDITRIGGLPFIEVSVNGQRGLALIDTGASLTYVNSRFAEGAARSQSSIRDIELVGATGSAVPVTILHSRRFGLGDFEVERFNVVVSDAEFLRDLGISDQPVMVLGLDVLKAFRLQIDRDREIVRFSIPNRGLRSGPVTTFVAR